MPRTSESLRLTPSQSHYVLGRLIEEGQVKASTVAKIAGEMADELRALEAKLAMLRGFANPPFSRDARGAKRQRVSRPASPEVTASRRLQGQYLGLIRQIPARSRKPFKKLAAQQGREAAVSALRKALAK